MLFLGPLRRTLFRSHLRRLSRVDGCHRLHPADALRGTRHDPPLPQAGLAQEAGQRSPHRGGVRVVPGRVRRGDGRAPARAVLRPPASASTTRTSGRSTSIGRRRPTTPGLPTRRRGSRDCCARAPASKGGVDRRRLERPYDFSTSIGGMTSTGGPSTRSSPRSRTSFRETCSV